LAPTRQDEVRIAPSSGADFGENAGNLGASRYVTGTVADGGGGLLHITVRGWRSLDNRLLDALGFDVPSSGALATADLSTLFGRPPSVAVAATSAPAGSASIASGATLRFTVVKAISETESDDRKYQTTRLLVDQLQGRGYTATLSAVDPRIDIRASAAAICADLAANTILAPAIKRLTSRTRRGRASCSRSKSTRSRVAGPPAVRTTAIAPLARCHRPNSGCKPSPRWSPR
jgi:hypothetical protein